MKKLSLFLVIAVLLAALPGAAWAEGSPWTKKNTYMEKMFGKLDYGLENIVFGTTRIISEPLVGIKDGGVVGGLTGVGTGVLHAVEYVGGGALHVVTFPITNLDVPLPGGGAHCSCSKK